VFEPYARWGVERYDDASSTLDGRVLAVAITHQLAAAVMDVAGLLFWALLAVGFLAAVFEHHFY